MAVQTIQLTLSGATRLTTTRTPINQIVFSRDAADYYVGTSNVDSTHGIKVGSADTENTVIGPFSAVSPMDASEFYLKGTDSHVLQVLLITF